MSTITVPVRSSSPENVGRLDPTTLVSAKTNETDVSFHELLVESQPQENITPDIPPVHERVDEKASGESRKTNEHKTRNATREIDVNQSVPPVNSLPLSPMLGTGSPEQLPIALDSSSSAGQITFEQTVIEQFGGAHQDKLSPANVTSMAGREIPVAAARSSRREMHSNGAPVNQPNIAQDKDDAKELPRLVGILPGGNHTAAKATMQSEIAQPDNRASDDPPNTTDSATLTISTASSIASATVAHGQAPSDQKIAPRHKDTDTVASQALDTANSTSSDRLHTDHAESTGSTTSTGDSTPASSVAAIGAVTARVVQPMSGTLTVALPTAHDEAKLPGVASQLLNVLTPLRPTGTGGHTITVALQPEGLGTVRANVTVNADQIVVRLIPATSEGAAALRASLPDLQSNLSNQGHHTTVVVSDDSQSNGARNDGQRQNNQDPSHASSPSVAPAPAMTGTVPVNEVEPTPSQVSRSALLDVRL